MLKSRAERMRAGSWWY